MRRFDDPHIRALWRQVEKPARYAGGELNAVDKRPAFFERSPKDRVHVALCFPDVYEIAMSNLAIQILYAILNEDDRTFCERCFAPGIDYRDLLCREAMPLTSIETGTPLADFDVVGISFQFELAFTTALDMLDLGGVPIMADDRTERDPLVIAGGPIACNLEPLAPMLDIVLIGDGEKLLPDIVDAVRLAKASGMSRERLLEHVAAMDGVYVPRFYDVCYNNDGTVRSIRPNTKAAPDIVSKAVIADLNAAPMPLSPIVPNMEIVHDRMVMEVLRGCPRGCRFCQAGFTYRPMRQRSVETLSNAADRLMATTGCEEMGLLSLSTTDYADLPALTAALLPKTDPRHINLSLPSLRLDAFEFDLAEQIAGTRRAGLTFAPEAGSQRLRDVINKNIVEDDLFEAAEAAFKNGWNRVKLYFMLGLPTETDDDVDAIARLAHDLLGLWDALSPETRARRLNITVSTSFFIPKPFTPFQWARQISIDEMRDKQQRLAKALGTDRRIAYNWHEFESSVIEAVLARGDRRLAPVLVDVWRQGGYLEAWHEHFSWDRWQRAMRRIPEGIDFYTRERPDDECFPWDHIDMGVDRAFLRREWERSLAGVTTPACFERCSACGCQTYRTGVCVRGRSS